LMVICLCWLAMLAG